MSAAEIVRRIRSRQDTLLVGTLVTLVSNGASVLFYGLGSVAAARALAPAEWGTALWYITGTTTVALFADVLGVYYANSYFFARREAGSDRATARGSVATYGIVAGTMVGAIAAYGPVRAAVFHGLDGLTWDTLIVANVAGLALVNQARGILLGEKRFVALGTLGFVKNGGFGLLTLVVVYGLRLRTAGYVAASHLASTIVTVAIGLAFMWRDGISLPRRGYIAKCARIGWRGACANLLSFLSQRASQYFVKSLLGSASLGLFGVAVSLGDVLTQAPGAIGLVLFPSAASDPSPDAADRRAARITLATIATMMVLVLPFVLVPDLIVGSLFGRSYAGATQILRFYAPAIALLSGLLVVNQHISGRGYPLGQVVIQALVLVVTVAANLTLLPRLGGVGASAATIVTYGLWLALDFAYLGLSKRGRGA